MRSYRRYLVWVICFACECGAANRYISNYVFEWSLKDAAVVERYLLSSAGEPAPNMTAAYILGMLYLEGQILGKNLQMADHYISMAARAGLPEAINAMGDSYYSGDIRKKNAHLALMYYERAAKMGFGPAQFNSGVVFLRTAKNKEDLRKAILYLDKAAKNGDDLGVMTKAALQYRMDAEEKLKKYR
jgi:TPR repeat protein